MRYLIFSLIFLTIWIILFLLNKKIRKEVLIASLIGTPTVLVEPFFVPGYWMPDSIISPKLSIEDFIIGFSATGVAVVLYRIFANRQSPKKLKISVLRLSLLIIFGLFVTFSIYYLIHINFIYATIIGGGAVTLLCLVKKSVTIKEVVLASLSFGIFYVVLFYLISNFLLPDLIKMWNLKSLSGVVVAKVPLEEMLWGLSFGALVGPALSFICPKSR